MHSRAQGKWRHYDLDELRQPDGSYKVDFDVKDQAVPTGQAVGLITSVEPAGVVVERMAKEAAAVLRRLGEKVSGSAGAGAGAGSSSAQSRL